MIKAYFKQAWQLLKQNKLFSSIYILGTGLSIAMTMTIVIIYYIKMAPVYPEWNRDRTMMAKGIGVQNKNEKGYSSSNLSYQTLSDYFYPLTANGAEAVTGIMSVWDDHPQVEFPGELGIQDVHVTYTDTHFWQVFTFTFHAGKPFSAADFQSGIKTAVISQSMSKKLFGNEEEATGRTFLLNNDEYRVSGVVRDVSYITPATFADVWVPFTVNPGYNEVNKWGHGYLGRFQTYILAKDKAAMATIKQVVDENIQKINASQDEYTVLLYDQPAPYWKSTFYEYSNQSPDWYSILKTFGTMLLALLFVPALNLAGMISSRMEHRLSELGVRKAFGASRHKLLSQILTENLLLTIMGGMVGLILSYLLIYTGRNWIPTLFAKFADAPPEGIDTLLTPGMLFNPTVFLITFGICLVLNLLSALIPAGNALRKNIVYSLNDKK